MGFEVPWFSVLIDTHCPEQGKKAFLMLVKRGSLKRIPVFQSRVPIMVVAFIRMVADAVISSCRRYGNGFCGENLVLGMIAWVFGAS